MFDSVESTVTVHKIHRLIFYENANAPIPWERIVLMKCWNIKL